MTTRSSPHVVRVLLAAACLAVLPLAPSAQQQQPPPRFKIGVEITPVDVPVLDERRRPVRGLTADDFVVRVDGKVQRIAAFDEIEIPKADKVAPLSDFATRNSGKAVSHKIIDTGTTGAAEIMRRLDLKPGRDNVRMAVTRSTDGKSGSIYTTFTVPDFQRDPLSLSGVAVGRAGGAAIGGREALAGVLPFAPTSIRDFARTDTVGALMRVHQSARRPARQVTVVTQIIDDAGKLMLTQSSTYEASRFVDGRGVDHRFELPLSALEPGDYLLTFGATSGEGGAQAQREVRFSVR